MLLVPLPPSSWRRLRWTVVAGVSIASIATASAAAQDSAYYNNAGTLGTSSAPPPATGEPGIIGADSFAAQQPGAAPVATPVPQSGGEPEKPRARKVKRCRTRHGRRTCRLYVNGSLTRSCTTRGHGKKRRVTCRFYAQGKKIRVCVKRSGHRRHCRRTAHGAVLTRASQPAPAAHVSTRIGGGYTNPVLGPVVRFYKSDSPVPTKGHCSGTLLRRGLVLTAAHCLFANHHDGNGQYGYYPTDSMWIAPANTIGSDGNDVAPYGTFRIVDAYVPNAWKADDGGADWGIAVIGPNSAGYYPGDYVGSYSAVWDARFPRGAKIWRAGYPATGAFRTPERWYGGGQYFCDDTWDETTYLGDPYVASSFPLVTTCEMNGGSSGGPVFVYFPSGGAGYSPADGGWYIVGVNNRGSDRADGFGDYGISFYFDDRFGEFWNAVLAALG